MPAVRASSSYRCRHTRSTSRRMGNGKISCSTVYHVRVTAIKALYMCQDLHSSSGSSPSAATRTTSSESYEQLLLPFDYEITPPYCTGARRPFLQLSSNCPLSSLIADSSGASCASNALTPGTSRRNRASYSSCPIVFVGSSVSGGGERYSKLETLTYIYMFNLSTWDP